MTDEEIKRQAARDLEAVLSRLGIQKAKKSGYICPSCGSGSGPKGTGAQIKTMPSGAVAYHCYSCGASGGLVSLVNIAQGRGPAPAGDTTAYNCAMDWLAGYMGTAREKRGTSRKPTAAPAPKPAASHATPAPKPPTPEELQKKAKAEAEARAYIAEARKNMDSDKCPGWSYLATRHFTPQQAAALVSTYGIGYKDGRLVIPYQDGIRYNARATDDTEPKYKKPNGVAMSYYDPARILEHPRNGVVFVTEGEIDALTVLLFDFPCIAAKKQDVPDIMRAPGATERVYVYLQDTDSNGAGVGHARGFTEAVRASGGMASYFPIVVNGIPKHDANDLIGEEGGRVALVDCLEELQAEGYDNGASWTAEAVASAKEDAEAVAENERLSSAGGIGAVLADLEGYRAATMGKAVTTGFAQIDKMLYGGFRPGLYVIGGGTGIGKTTFSLQMLINALEATPDATALVATTEMSMAELAAKTLSRYTKEAAETAAAHGISEAVAVPAVDILQGNRHANIDGWRSAALAHAVERLRRLDGRLVIKDLGMGGKASEICDSVKALARFSARPPLVLVDYLQMLAPENPNGTDKANLDAAIRAFKATSRETYATVIVITSYTKAALMDKDGNGNGTTAFSGTAAIGYTADYALDIERAKPKDGQEGLYDTTVKSTKHRFSEEYSAYLKFDGAGNRYTEPDAPTLAALHPYTPKPKVTRRF